MSAVEEMTVPTQADMQGMAEEGTATACQAGVLLVNLGTPDAPEPAALRRYLAEFLWDPRLVPLPRPLWWLILHGLILRLRPRRAARAYRSIWTEEGSPLLAISRRLAAALEAALARHCGQRVPVVLGMRYGNPAIAAALDELQALGAERILVLPLYPQYASATTASVFDAVATALRRRMHLPEFHFIGHYHDQSWYIGALAESVRRVWAGDEASRERLLLFSFHGMPERTRAAGDPYYEQCHETARRVAAALGLPASRWRLAFQSRFGREPWLQPYTDEILRALPDEGVSAVDVICPGFAADCLETLEEIRVLNRRLFLEAGGRDFRYIPALNDDPRHVDGLAALVAHHLHPWLSPPGMRSGARHARGQSGHVGDRPAREPS